MIGVPKEYGGHFSNFFCVSLLIKG